MSYAKADERGSLIAGLRALAGFLEGHPDVPAPRRTDVLVFPPDSSDAEAQSEVAAIAALIGAAASDETASGGHYTACRSFGPVQYQAVAIPLRARKPSVRSQNEEA